jgi:hypothetical protein
MEEATVYNPVVNKDIAMMPFEVLYNSQGFGVGGLLQIDT